MNTWEHPRWRRALLAWVVWVVPVLLIGLASVLIPVDPDAQANMFGPIGLRQDVVKWLVVGTPIIWVLGSKLLRLGYWWIPIAVVLGFGGLLLLTQWDAMVGLTLIPVVLAPLLGAWFAPPPTRARPVSP